MSDKRNAISDGPWVDIDLSALCANYAMVRDAAPGAAMSAVVKCDAYGLGVTPVARALFEREKCDTFFVVYPEEGAKLRETLQSASPTIYVFDGARAETLPLFEQYKLLPTFNSLEEAKLWSARMGNAPAGLHIDTGMNRRGASIHEVPPIADLNLNITMVMSHLACASEPTHPKNKTQQELFAEETKYFPEAKLSLAASAGALMDREYHFDLIRAGIALYGGAPFETDDERIKPVVTLNAPIVQLRDISPGETVGYGAIFTANRPTKVATVAIGYGDGFPRAGVERASAIISGERAPLIGRVSMDFITFDITDLKNPPKLYDIVEIFGPNLRLHEAAQNFGMVTYDLLTGLGGRIDRRYL